MKCEFLIANPHGVTCVCASIEPNGCIEFGTKQVDDLPFAFITPPKAEYATVLARVLHSILEIGRIFTRNRKDEGCFFIFPR